MTIRIKEQTIDLTGLTDMTLRKDCCGAVWFTLTLSFQNRGLHGVEWVNLGGRGQCEAL